MAAVIGMSLFTLRLRDADATRARCVAAGLVGAVLVWFSQAAMLVLVGLGGALLLAWLLERDVKTARALRIAVPIWAVACVASALVAVRLVSSATRAFMDHFWRIRGGFPPWPIQKPKDLLWLWDRVTQVFAEDMLLRYRWPALYTALAVVGLIALWRRNRVGALVLVGPFAAAVFAAVAQQYPFRARLILVRRPRARPGGGRGRGTDPDARFESPSCPRRGVHGGAVREPGLVLRPRPSAVLRRGSQERVRLRA